MYDLKWMIQNNVQAAAWKNPSWLSNKKDSRTPKDKKLPGGNESPHWKKHPQFCAGEGWEGRDSAFFLVSLNKEPGQAQWRRKRWSSPQQTMLYLLLEFNFKANDWVMMAVPELFNLSYMVLAHIETMLKISVLNESPQWWGLWPCKQLLGSFSVSHSWHKCINTVPCFNCWEIRSAETFTCLRFSSITTPSTTKLWKKCDFKRVLIIKPIHLWFLSFMLSFQDLFTTHAQVSSLFPKPAFSENPNIRRLVRTTLRAGSIPYFSSFWCILTPKGVKPRDHHQQPFRAFLAPMLWLLSSIRLGFTDALVALAGRQVIWCCLIIFVSRSLPQSGTEAKMPSLWQKRLGWRTWARAPDPSAWGMTSLWEVRRKTKCHPDKESH